MAAEDVSARLAEELVKLSVRVNNLERLETSSYTAHDPVTLDANSVQVNSLTGQELGHQVQAHNFVWVGPESGASAVPMFRMLVAADIPGHFERLQEPLTSTSWDGDAKATTDSGTLDLSAVFGAPAGISAALISVYVKDASVSQSLSIGPYSTYNNALTLNTQVANVYLYAQGIVPCNNDGDFYVKLWHDMDNVGIAIWGYWIP